MRIEVQDPERGATVMPGVPIELTQTPGRVHGPAHKLGAGHRLAGVVVGSGTVLDARQIALSEELGCAFAVSPGATPSLIAAARDHTIPLLPASASPSEAMVLAEHGYRLQKFFPAEPSGGAPYLSSLASPLPRVKFCPTGGLTQDNAPGYLELANVMTVGGSWMAPRKLVAEGNWPAITISPSPSFQPISGSQPTSCLMALESSQ